MERSDKTVKQFLTVLIALMFLALQACEGPAGPAGAAGQKGDKGDAGADAGFVYFDGFKDSLKCATCHNPEVDTVFYTAGRTKQWEHSLHGSGTAWEENRAACAECHTTEGFMRKVAGQPVTDVLHPTPPGCFACHSPHSTGEYGLRTVAPVTLNSNIVGVANATFDKGEGNLCVACHRPRTLTPQPDPTKTAATDSIVITSSRWYAHYGVQGQVLIGAGAFQFTDAAPYPSTTAHSSGTIATKGCATCHMADYTPANAYGGVIGGHTMHMRFNTTQLTQGCKTCHTSTSFTSLDYQGKQTQVTALMDSLKGLLVAKGWINTSDALQVPKTIKPASRAGALFNYMLLLHDGSKGTHNPAYAIAMLNASIAELNKP